ncbi:MAG: hypothetical protein Ct9H300mP10_06000 [Methanobacteriota archaeon]|nr:MAG: hypothetical protein Ct9H300mP10_06000 [Euryarchaeota archaeon]
MPGRVEGNPFESPPVGLLDGDLDPTVNGYSHSRGAVDHCMFPEQDTLSRRESPRHDLRPGQWAMSVGLTGGCFKDVLPPPGVVRRSLTGEPMEHPLLQSYGSLDGLGHPAHHGRLSIGFFLFQVQKATRLVLLGAKDDRFDSFGRRESPSSPSAGWARRGCCGTALQGRCTC